MTTGTGYSTGINTRRTYSGTTAATDNSRLRADTKLVAKTAVIRCTSTGTGETETGFTLPTNAIVKDVMLNVITLDAGETVDVGTMGTSNDPDGYLDGVSIAALGLVRGSLDDGSVTLGVLLFEITEAVTAAARNVDITAGGDPISFTASAAGAVFDIIISYVEVVSEIN